MDACLGTRTCSPLCKLFIKAKKEKESLTLRPRKIIYLPIYLKMRRTNFNKRKYTSTNCPTSNLTSLFTRLHVPCTTRPTMMTATRKKK